MHGAEESAQANAGYLAAELVAKVSVAGDRKQARQQRVGYLLRYWRDRHRSSRP